MPTVGKVAGGGAAILGGGGAVGYGVKYVLEMEPKFITLVSSTSFDSDYKNKYGDKDDNKNSFIDPDQNEKWWDWVYTYFFKPDKDGNSESIHTSFGSVAKSYDASDSTALNQVCKVAFKKEPKEVTNIKYKKSIWKYCSKDRNNLAKHEIPPTFYTLDSDKNTSQISEATKLGGISDNKPKLVADVADNEEGWNWIYENRFNADKEDSTKKAAMDASFSAVTSGYSGSASTTALNKVCVATHSKVKTDFDGDKAKLKTDIEAYCTKSGSGDSLEIPKT